jgi:histidinol-phosphate aminotransferase
VEEVPMRGWRHNLDAMADACTNRTKIVFVASPNNPTGTWNTERELAAFLERVPRSTLVVLDEAYWHYAADRPLYHARAAYDLIRLHSNLVVLRTFSKAYGLAGLRVGYGVGDPELVRWLDRIRMPFNVNLPAQHAAEAALLDPEFVAASVRLIDEQRPLLRRSLEGLGLVCEDTATNFLFADMRRDAKALFSSLLRQGVIVRPLGEYGLKTHLRFTVGNAAQNRRLVAALRHVLGGNGQRASGVGR